jgi:hypothetical protein
MACTWHFGVIAQRFGKTAHTGGARDSGREPHSPTALRPPGGLFGVWEKDSGPSDVRTTFTPPRDGFLIGSGGCLWYGCAEFRTSKPGGAIHNPSSWFDSALPT